jgi:hypothetical protein
MGLWQMDIVGNVRLVDGGEAKVVSGIDDQRRSRTDVSVQVMCHALGTALKRLRPGDQRCRSPRHMAITDADGGPVPADSSASDSAR